MADKKTNADIDVLDRIRAMLSHEAKTSRCHNYLTSDAEAACRKAIVDWCFIVCDSFDGLSRETVGIAAAILDRYLSSGKGRSAEALPRGKGGKQMFQLAAITSFYIAGKMVEPDCMGIQMILKLCRGVYKERDILAMEQDILSSLEWRISLSTTTPMEYVRHFLKLLPEWSDAADVILKNAATHMHNATSDIYFSTCKTSYVGIACLAGALKDAGVPSPLEEDAIWYQLSRKVGFDIASTEIKEVEMKLRLKSTSCEPRRPSRVSLHRRSIATMSSERTSSPVCVLQVAP